MILILLAILLYNNTTLTINKTESKNINLIVKSHLGGGFFCEFGKVIKNLIHYQNNNIVNISIDWTDQFFPFKNEPKENGWDLFFEPIKTNHLKEDLTHKIYNQSNCNIHELHDQDCTCLWTKYDKYLPYRIYVNQFINRYIRIKTEILNQLDLFYQQKMYGALCIGVHVRYASAHIHEAPYGHPELKDYCHEIDKIITQHNDQKNIKIFLATDSHKVINYFNNYYKNKVIYIDTYRAQDREDAGVIYENAEYWINHPSEWHRTKPGYIGGLGVLLDCLLLSKCEYLVHITSNVSSFACYFNPYLKSIYLPRNIPFKPCKHYGDKNIVNPYINPS